VSHDVAGCAGYPDHEALYASSVTKSDMGATMENSRTINVYQGGNSTDTQEQLEVIETDSDGDLSLVYWSHGKNKSQVYMDPDTARKLAIMLLEAANG
jgi:hypothetical protein